MSSPTLLSQISEFIDEKVAKTIRLQKPSEDDEIDSYELTNPAVFEGWVPPTGFIPDGVRIPALVVGLGSGVELRGDPKTTEEVVITVIVYSPGTHKIVDGKLQYTPDFKGYIDLMNVIDRIRLELRRISNIGGYELSEKVEWKVSDEPAYPYWYGHVKFNLEKPLKNILEINLD